MGQCGVGVGLKFHFYSSFFSCIWRKLRQKVWLHSARDDGNSANKLCQSKGKDHNNKIKLILGFEKLVFDAICRSDSARNYCLILLCVMDNPFTWVQKIIPLLAESPGTHHNVTNYSVPSKPSQYSFSYHMIISPSLHKASKCRRRKDVRL